MCVTVVCTALKFLYHLPQPHPSTGHCWFSSYAGVQENGTYWNGTFPHQSGNTEAYSSPAVKSCNFNQLKSTYVSLNHLRTLIPDPWNELKNVHFLFRVHHVDHGVDHDKRARATHAGAWKQNQTQNSTAEFQETLRQQQRHNLCCNTGLQYSEPLNSIFYFNNSKNNKQKGV